MVTINTFGNKQSTTDKLKSYRIWIDRQSNEKIGKERQRSNAWRKHSQKSNPR